MELPEFEAPQFYETAIAMRDLGEEFDREFRYLCLPTAAIHTGNRHLLADPPELLSVLGLSELLELPVAQLSDAIFALQIADEQRETAVSAPDLLSTPAQLAEQRQVRPDLALFAEYLAFAEVVPFEQSKVSGGSLATLAMKSYEKAATVAGLASLAPALGPHGAVVFLAMAAGASAVCVVDSIGVVVGIVTSQRTAEAISSARRGIRRLIHRPSSERTVSPEAETPEETRQRERDESLARKRERLKELARRRGPIRLADGGLRLGDADI